MFRTNLKKRSGFYWTNDFFKQTIYKTIVFNWTNDFLEKKFQQKFIVFLVNEQFYWDNDFFERLNTERWTNEIKKVEHVNLYLGSVPDPPNTVSWLSCTNIPENMVSIFFQVFWTHSGLAKLFLRMVRIIKC